SLAVGAPMKVTRFLLLILLLLPAMGFAQNPKMLRVGLVPTAPFVNAPTDAKPGISIELWRAIVDANAWACTYTDYKSTDEALKALIGDKIDVVVGATSINKKRRAEVDFSQPFFRAGLQIMISEVRPHTFDAVWESLTDPAHLTIFGVLVVVVIVLCVFVTLFERKHNPDFPKTWQDGFAESFYYVAALMFTGKSVYKGFPGVIGRLTMIIWMVAGVFFVAYITSSITSVMTVQRLKGNINGPDDLAGRTIGDIEGTTSMEYLSEHGIQHIDYKDIPSAVADLVPPKGGTPKIEALIYDAPLLEYYDNQHQKIPITEVGPIFQPENYGFAVRKGSDLREPIDESLLFLLESGFIQKLGEKYLGLVFKR
ncbi:MAG: transporter substrate-binding domain-containing protein, partial [Chthoniobacterales bacterium]